MPDMSKPGAHLKDCLSELRYKQEDHFREARKHEIMAQTYQEAAMKLERALDKEAERSSQSEAENSGDKRYQSAKEVKP